MANISKSERERRARESQGAGSKKPLPKKSDIDIDAIEAALDNHSDFLSSSEKSITPHPETPPVQNTGHQFQQPVDQPVDGQPTNNNVQDVAFEEITNPVGEDIDFIPEEISPMQERVIVNDYENTTAPNINNGQAERIIPQPVVNPLPLDILQEKEKIDETKSDDKKEKEPTKKINPDMDDLSPSQRRKNAEQDADAIITTYSNFLPVVPKWMAKFDMDKLQKLEMKGEVSLSMPIMEDGTTIRMYCEGVNNKADELFVVTTDMKNAIKEPLVEVMLEKGFAMTPMQRLAKVLVEHALQFGAMGFQMMMEGRNAITQFKDFRQQANAQAKQNNTEQTVYQEQVKQPERTEQNPAQEERHRHPQDVKRNDEATIISESKTSDIKLNDVLNQGNDSSITIEEVIIPDGE